MGEGRRREMRIKRKGGMKRRQAKAIRRSRGK